MKTTIEILGITRKIAQKTQKPYWEVETKQGKMTVHDESLVKELSRAYADNKLAEIEMVESGDWKNIRKVYGMVDYVKGPGGGEVKPERIEEMTKEINERAPKARREVPRKDQISIFISYAKDLACEKIIDPSKIRYWVQEFKRIYEEE